MHRRDVTIRPADGDDLTEVIDVCGRALNWGDDDRNARFFAWKHLENPFGPSPIWVAEVEEPTRAVVGVRALMRWDLLDPAGRRRPMTRAVDTATLPDHQGKGIFTRLTKAAVSDLTADGAAAVFNTPNDKSRPGYLKMGWETVGRVPVSVRPRTPGSLVAMLRSRTAAEKWGQPTDVGLDPATALADGEAVAAAIERVGEPTGWSTPLSLDYLRWRTGFAPLAARIELLGSSPADGFVVFRLRRRGALQQLSILHLVAPPGAGRRRAIGRLLERTGADVALACGSDGRLAEAMLPLPKAGPILTWRPLADTGVPHRRELDLPLGAIELF